MSQNSIELCPHCIICDAQLWRPLYDCLETCTQCGFVRAHQSPNWANPEDIYQESYFHGDEYGDYLGDEGVFRRNFERRFQEVRSRTTALSSVLEVGCAFGFFLDYTTQLGLDSEGIDICSGPTRFARERLGLNAHCGDFLTFDFDGKTFDLVCFWDTIEHLVEPDRFLARAFSLLNQGGTIALTTGNIGSKFASSRKGAWRMIHPPSHLHYFSEESIRALLVRLGFHHIEVRSAPIFRDLRSVLLNLASLNKGLVGRLAEFFSKIIPQKIQRIISCWVDFGDIMLVTAKRP